MAIWFEQNLNLEKINQMSMGTMLEYLNIKISKVGEDFLEGTMPVDHRTIQPHGLLHGGASCVLAETLGSLSSNFCLNPKTQYAVGLSINANHIRSTKEGIVLGRATPIHLGKTTHVWEIKLMDQTDHLICISRLTMAIKIRNNSLPGKAKGPLFCYNIF